MADRGGDVNVYLSEEYIETLTLSDTFSRVWLLSSEFTETLSLTDSITNGKIFSETLTLLDTVGRVWSATPEFIETLTLTDGDTYFTEINLEEAITLTDTFSRVLNITFELAETLNLTDSYAYNWTLSREFEEVLTLSDNVNNTTSLSALCIETLSLSDTISRTWNATPELTETLTLSDGDEYKTTINLLETLTLSDGDTHKPGAVLTEILTLTDNISYNWGLSREFTETLLLTDTPSYTWDLAREFTEILTLLDGDEYFTSIDLSETLTLTDTIIPLGVKVLTETLTLTDTFSRVWSATPEFTETITLVDGDTYKQSLTLTETLNLQDTRGTTNDTTLYIKNSGGQWVEYKDYEFFKIVRKQNQISEFEISILNIEASDKVFVKEFAEVLFLSGADLILKGRIQKITYETGYKCKITGYGMEAKLLDKEFSELSNTTATWSDDKRAQYTNASAQTIAKELLSAGSDGAATWIMQPGYGGIFDSDYGDTSIRFEYANRLKALAALSESLVDPTYQGAYEWWVSQSPIDDYGLDTFNLSNLQPTTTRATVSQETFAISGGSSNASQTFHEKDITNLANKVDVLGYGDGINQIHTSTFNASPIYSTLASDIAVGAASIVLVDAGDFASSGEVRIMEERVTYSGKTSNTLTGCTRGANSTTARPHNKGVYVEKYVAIASAEADSSISDNGLMDYSVTKREIIDLPTAESVASRILMDRMTPITSIRIIPNEPLQTAASRQVGDMITVVDAESAISGDYRIVGITYQSDYGYLSMELEVSNKTLNFIDQMASQKAEAEKLSKYMQGATNLYWFGNEDNCDSSHPLSLNIYIPEDAVAINKVNLRFSRPSFKGYVTSSSSGKKEGSYLINVATIDQEVNSVSTTIALSDSVNGEGTFLSQTIIGSIWNLSGTSHNYRIHYENPVGTIIYNDNGTAESGGDNTLQDTDKSWTVNELANKLVKITAGTGASQIRKISSNTSDTLTISLNWSTNPSSDSQYIIYGQESALSDGANLTLPQFITSDERGSTWGIAFTPGTGETYGTHTGDNMGVSLFTEVANFGIFEPASESDVNVEIKVDGNSVTTINNVSVDYEYPSDIDLTDYIDGTGWVNITLTPTGLCRLSPNGYTKCFIQSK